MRKIRTRPQALSRSKSAELNKAKPLCRSMRTRLCTLRAHNLQKPLRTMLRTTPAHNHPTLRAQVRTTLRAQPQRTRFAHNPPAQPQPLCAQGISFPLKIVRKINKNQKITCTHVVPILAPKTTPNRTPKQSKNDQKNKTKKEQKNERKKHPNMEKKPDSAVNGKRNLQTLFVI